MDHPTINSMYKRRYHNLSSPIANHQVCNYVTEAPDIAYNETYSVIKSKNLQHWFKNWQEPRLHKLTASTFGSAIGFWPKRRAQLWLEKIGALEPFTGNLATCWTNIKEEEALANYKLITGHSVIFPTFQIDQKLMNPEDEHWLAASPDGFVIESEDGSGLRGVLEMKCPFFGGDMSKATPWKRVPLYYMPQAQGLMEIMDCDWMDFYVWTPKGSSLFRIHRDVEYWAVLREALADFWWKHVVPARKLYKKNVMKNPRVELSMYVPEPRHELCTSIIHRSKLLVDKSELLIREIYGVLQN